MPSMRPVLNDFSAGEISPRLAGRIDLGVYQKGAQELTNFQVRTLGGVTKRPGTKYVQNTRSDASARLIPWAIDASTTIIIELTAGHIRFIDATSGGFLQSAPGVNVDLPSSYTSADLFQIKYAQTYRECYLVHPLYPPFWFRWQSGTVTSAVFDYNSADQSFAGNLLSWTAPTTTPYDLYDLWEQMGSWLVPRKSYTATGTFNGKTLSSIMKQELSLVLTFSDASTLTLTRGTTYSYQGSISVDLRPFMGAGNYPGSVCYFAGRLWMGGSINDPNTLWGSKPWDFRNFVLCETIEYTASEKTPANRTDYVGTAASGSATISSVSPAISGSIVGKYITGKYIAYGSKVVSNTADSIVLDRNAVAAGTDGVSASDWKDANVPEYADTVKDTTQIGAGNAIRIILATEEDESILWMAGGQDLYVGTTCSEWVIAGQSNATQAKAQLVSRYGSANIQSRFVGEAIMFVTPASRHIRQLAVGGGALQPPLTAQAEHLVKDGIVQFDFAQSPNISLFAVVSTGDAIRCLMEPSSGIMAWDRIRVRSGDAIESVCIVPGATRDMVYFVVKRTINSLTRRFIEVLQENEDDIFTNQWYLDAGASFSSGGTLSVPWLANQLVTYRYSVGGVETIATGTVNASGQLTVPTADAVQVGLPFVSYLKTHRIEALETEGLTKGVGTVFFRLFRSYSFILRYSKDTTLPAMPVSLTGPYTGPLPVSTDIPMSIDAELVIESSDPVPVGIQTIVPNTEIGG